MEPEPISGVSHLSLSVRDLDRSLAFYRDVMGLTVFVEPFDGQVFEVARPWCWRVGSR